MQTRKTIAENCVCPLSGLCVQSYPEMCSFGDIGPHDFASSHCIHHSYASRGSVKGDGF